MGGIIRVETKESAGTQITIEIPVQKTRIEYQDNSPNSNITQEDSLIISDQITSPQMFLKNYIFSHSMEVLDTNKQEEDAISSDNTWFKTMN